VGKYLLVDDDLVLGAKVQESFAAHGLDLEWVTSGGDALQMLANYEYELILLDWNLPDMTGLVICQQYRKGRGEAYIIFLTGESDLENKEKALDSGGDDYLVKPFDFRELFARMRSVMRRALVLKEEEIRIGEVAFHIEQRTVTANGEKVQLTSKESAMLEILMRHPDRPYNAQRLMSAAWPSDSEASVDTVRTWMKLLRQKLARLGKADFIKTVVGAGYVIEGADGEARL